MRINVRRTWTLGAAVMALALPVVAPAQQKSSFTAPLRIDQNLGGTVPMNATFNDETGATRTFGSLFKGRPVLVVPFPLKKTAGCGVAIEGLQKTLFKAAHPNDRKLIQMAGPNLLEVGRTFDIVFLSLDPSERPTDAAATKNEFQTKLGFNAEPVTALTGDLANIRKVTDALGFHYFINPAKRSLRNPTGSVLLTPDGRISSYTIGNEFQTKVFEGSVVAAQAGQIGSKADESSMFACVQLDTEILARRGKIEAIITGVALATLAIVVFWIGSMLREERRQHRNPLGGNPGGA